MNGLDVLLKTSLIGTEKLPLDVEGLPISIKTAIANKNKDAEELVLSGAALLFFYNNSGLTPQKIADNNFQKIVETKLTANAKATKILQVIETTGYYEKEYLYNFWLDKLIEKNEIVTANFIMPLINAGIGFNKITKAKIIEVIGETGKLIIPLKPDFKVKGLLAAEKDDVWKEGNSNERKIFLEELIHTDAEKALELIEKDWALESITFKKSILEIIIQKPTAAIMSFIEKLYIEEFAFTTTEKTTVTQCRYLLAKALLQNEKSNLQVETKANVTAYCEIAKKGILGKLISGNNKIKINLPKEKDGFLNPENVKAIYGIEPVNTNPAYFDNDISFWFSELLAIIPLQIWTSIFDTNEKEVFQYFLDNQQYKTTIHGQKVNIFYNSIQANLAFSKNQHLIMHLLSLEQKNITYQLAAHLDATNFETFAVKNNLLLEPNFMYYYETENGEWTVDFSAKMIKETYTTMIDKQQYIDDSIRNMICKFTHEGTNVVLDKLFLQESTSTFKEMWIEQIYKPTKKVLEIKQDIKQL
jgi:Family of unknown function (DUF5691)